MRERKKWAAKLENANEAFHSDRHRIMSVVIDFLLSTSAAITRGLKLNHRCNIQFEQIPK